MVSDDFPAYDWTFASTPTSLPPRSLTPSSLPPVSLPPTSLPPTSLPPTSLPPRSLTPTTLTPTSLPPTSLPPSPLAPLTRLVRAPQPPKPSQRWIPLVAALVAIALGIVTALVWRSGHPAASPRLETAKRFFAALSHNDAGAARAEAVVPDGDDSVLTDGALALAHKLAGLGPVTLTDGPDSTVQASYTLGSTAVNDTLRFTTGTDVPKITNAYSRLDVTQVARPTAPLTVAGVRVLQNTLLLLPGRYPVSAGFATLSYGDGSVTAVPDRPLIGAKELPLQASESGVEAFRHAVREKLSACAGAKTLAPSACPFSYQPAPGETIEPSSIRWTVQNDPVAALVPKLGASPAIARSVFPLKVSLSATAGGKPVAHDVQSTVNAVVDLTATSPDADLEKQ